MITDISEVASITGNDLTTRHELVSVYGHVMPIRSIRVTAKAVHVVREDGQAETFGLTERVMVTSASHATVTA